MMGPSVDPPPSVPHDSRISSASDDTTEYELNASGVRKRPASNGSNHSPSLVASGGPRHSHASSGSSGSSSSATASSTAPINAGRDPRRSSILSRTSSTGTGSNLRDTFFKTKSDPLEESSHNEFNLTIIDEEGVISKTPGDSTAHPSAAAAASSSSSSLIMQWWRTEWSSAGYVVVRIASSTVLVTYVATLLSPTLDGYDIDPGLVLGSLQTLILCAIVVITYHGVHLFQAHPNPLIYYKCLIDMLLAMRFLLDPWLLRAGVYHVNDRHSCAYLSGVTQLLYLTSDCWYFALIFDLYKSIKNPFTSVQADRNKYIAFVTVVGLASGVLTSTVSSFHGFADGNFCWTHRGDRQERNFWRLNVASWILFYDWMIVFYLSGIGVLIYGRRRLKSGLKLTLDSRREMRRHSAISIMSFTAYWTIAFTWYAISFSARTHYEADGRISPSKIFRSYSYTLAGRGAVDYFVWFMINKPSRMTAHWMKFSSESADHKFSAQLNTALQRELIFFTNEGMIRAVQLADDELLRTRERSPTQELVRLGHQLEREDTAESARGSAVSFETPSGAPVMNVTRTGTMSMQDLEASRVTTNTSTSPTSGCSTGMGPSRRSFLTYLGFSAPATASTAGSAATKAPSVVASNVSTASYTSEQSIKFTPYKSEAFAELRSACGIKTADFMASFEASTKPSISEGASGAFLFFSGDKRFIVKSMAEDECRFLCDIADAYVEYLITNPRSLVTKFFGCFKITLYEKKFYFVVMENLFDVMEHGVTIHHRYDIKGSWVNRSYSRPRRGAKLKCRHCSMQFKYGAANRQCPNVVGRHEPNVVLKDNDLRTRMRIGVDAGRELYETLRDDSLFLCSLGIMDYSLLLGVTDIEFLVDQPTHSDHRRNTVTSNPNASSSMSGSQKPRTASGHSTSTHSSTASTRGGGGAEGGGGGDVPITRESLAMLDDGTTPLQRGSSSTIAGAPPTYHTKSLARFHSSRSLGSSADAVVRSSTAPPPPSTGPPKHSMRKSERVFGPGFYYIGIIDILQQWTTTKRLERFWKVHVQRCDGNGLSAMDPVRYQRRFEAKLREIIAIPRDVHTRASTPSRPLVSVPNPGTRGGRGFSDGSDHGLGGGGGGGGGGGEDDEEELVDLEQGIRSNPQPILMRVGSHQRRANANANANATTANANANVQAL